MAFIRDAPAKAGKRGLVSFNYMAARVAIGLRKKADVDSCDAVARVALGSLGGGVVPVQGGKGAAYLRACCFLALNCAAFKYWSDR